MNYKNELKMKHCILMTVYKDLDQINRIIDVAPANFDFFVHIDKKSKLKIKDISKRAKVYSEYRIFWGAVEHLKAFLFLMDKALKSNKKYDFYHLITGQDFYACPFKDFDSLLEEGKNYMEIIKLPRKGWWNGGFHIIKYKTLASKFDLRKRKYKAFDRLYYLYQRILRKEQSIPNYQMCCGSVYCSISGGAISYILNSDISKNLLSRLDNTTCSEEIFFQTVLFNSPYKAFIVDSNLRYMDWDTPKPPKFLQENDYNKIRNTKCLFCRKIDSVMSKALILKLENILYIDN